MTGGDPFDLRRFVDAQARIYDIALDEIAIGRKRSHWMWFVFPQLRGLGRSSMTLFERAAGPGEPLFQTAIDHLCAGRPDTTTLDLLREDAR